MLAVGLTCKRARISTAKVAPADRSGSAQLRAVTRPRMCVLDPAFGGVPGCRAAESHLLSYVDSQVRPRTVKYVRT
jgi:hypothetical protein